MTNDQLADSLTDAEVYAEKAMREFNECLSSAVAKQSVTAVELWDADDNEWWLKVKPNPDAELPKHRIEELSLVLMAFAVRLQMVAEKL